MLNTNYSFILSGRCGERLGSNRRTSSARPSAGVCGSGPCRRSCSSSSSPRRSSARRTVRQHRPTWVYVIFWVRRSVLLHKSRRPLGSCWVWEHVLGRDPRPVRPPTASGLRSCDLLRLRRARALQPRESAGGSAFAISLYSYSHMLRRDTPRLRARYLDALSVPQYSFAYIRRVAPFRRREGRIRLRVLLSPASRATHPGLGAAWQPVRLVGWSRVRPPPGLVGGSRRHTSSTTSARANTC